MKNIASVLFAAVLICSLCPAPLSAQSKPKKPAAKPAATPAATSKPAEPAREPAPAAPKPVAEVATPRSAPATQQKAAAVSGQAFSKGASYLGARIGIGTIGYGGLPIGGQYEYGITENIGVGLTGDFTSYDFGLGYKFNYIFIGLQGNYHFIDLLKDNPKIDVFAGLTVGYAIFSFSGDESFGVFSNASGIYVALQGGARYFFTDNIAAEGRLGYGLAILTLGITFKF